MATDGKKERKERESTIQVTLSTDIKVNFPGTSIKLTVPAGSVVRVFPSDLKEAK